MSCNVVTRTLLEVLISLNHTWWHYEMMKSQTNYMSLYWCTIALYDVERQLLLQIHNIYFENNSLNIIIFGKFKTHSEIYSCFIYAEVVCVCFVDGCLSFCPFSCGYCVVWYSSIYGFFKWYPQTLLNILFISV